MSRAPHNTAELPAALGSSDLRRRLTGRSIAVFTDYDGTLTPIVARPELARIADDTLSVLVRLAQRCVVGIISGRDLEDLRGMVSADRVWLAGSHGMDLLAPDGSRHEAGDGRMRSVLAAAADALDREVAGVPGAWVERKRFADAVHFRQVDDALVPEVAAAVERVAVRYPELRTTGGKRIFELRPEIDWHKGRALWWLFEQAGLRTDTVVPIYIGDDLTDEDAFVALGDRGVGIVVDDGGGQSAADFRVADTEEVRILLAELEAQLEETGS